MSILFDAWRRARGEDTEVTRALGAPAVGPARHGGFLPWFLCGVLLVIVAGLGAYLWRVHLGQGRPAGVQAALTGGAGVPASSPVPGPGPAQRKRVLAEKPLAAGPAAPPAAGSPAPAARGKRASGAVQADGEGTPAAASSTVPDSVRAALPPLTVTVHVWNPDPAARFVMVGGHVYHEGDDLGSGLKLVSITPDGEVVRFRGYLVTIGR